MLFHTNLALALDASIQNLQKLPPMAMPYRSHSNGLRTVANESNVTRTMLYPRPHTPVEREPLQAR